MVKTEDGKTEDGRKEIGDWRLEMEEMKSWGKRRGD
jgi:hypothetical protein